VEQYIVQTADRRLTNTLRLSQIHYLVSGAAKRLGEHLEKEDVPRIILGIIVLVLGALMLADGVLGITQGMTIFFKDVNPYFKFVVGFITIILGGQVLESRKH